MFVDLDLLGFRVDKEKSGTFCCYPYAGRRLLKYTLNLPAVWYISEFFEPFLWNGIAVQSVSACTYIDLLSMPVKGGCDYPAHCCAASIIHKLGGRDVKHGQPL